MTNLEHAISRFQNRAIDAQSSEESKDFAFLANALEEIRDLLTADKQPNTEEQPPAFESWDCVKAKPGTDLYDEWKDAELVLGHQMDTGEYRVFNPDDDRDCLAYEHLENLIFVRRLKPRAQEPQPVYQGIVGINTDKERSNEDLLRAAGYEQRQPVFKRGDIVRNIFDIEEYSYEVMQDTNGPRVQLRDCKTGQPRAFVADDLRKIDKSAPFQVGDWVQRENGNTDKIAAIGEWWVDTERGHTWPKSTITKIDPPAPRFTFGDRVRVEQGRIIFRFICASDTHAQILEEDTNITHHVPLHTLTLDTAAD